MRSLNEYITESKYFKLEDSERDALAALIGVLCGAMGDDEIEESCAELIKELTDKEKEQLEELYSYVLDNKYDYPTINRNIIKDDIPLIKKIIEWLDENDAWPGSNDVELLDILDKINTK